MALPIHTPGYETNMLYADDLELTTNDPGEMQTMLNKLRTYAEKNELTVNTSKSEVVHYISKSVSPLASFRAEALCTLCLF